MSLQRYRKAACIAFASIGVLVVTLTYFWQNNNNVDLAVSTSESGGNSESITSKKVTDAGSNGEINDSFISKEVALTLDDESQQYVISNNQDSESRDTVLTLDDNWCVPREQLSSEDVSYLAKIQQDWNEIQGIAPAYTPDVGYGDELYDQSSAYIDSYLAMEIDNLEDLSLSGDKWAMIAYLQKPKALSRRSREREVAKELLISGATYHAIEFLIRNEFLQAKTSFRNTKNAEGSRTHLVNAAAYTMLGLKYYNTSALTAYASMVANDEMFKSFLNPSLILSESNDEIISRFSEITKEIRLTRKSRNIHVPEVPDEIKKLFSLDLAHFEFHHKTIMAQLKSWQDATIGELGISECTNEHKERLAKIYKGRK
ncbi:hypothetical protein SAMN05216361_0535 [Marisediminitalea aggregata]|uniref:Uncharacterized protein n=1 Tax=Marisediminitalea aggregata TaxID=634436 RepID=A0A1M5ETP7_9ALTE|nr:hypothetical protein [Marisediminitalea aggregata]SHF82554.1 hypothetical protein SAMN05216361_0535 [Marisediminitalea aggregata]